MAFLLSDEAPFITGGTLPIDGGFHRRLTHIDNGAMMTVLTADVRRLLEGANYAHLATLLPDGAPHSVPVWIGVEGDRITVLTSPASRKARNVRRDPRVSISVTDNDQPYRSALVRGHVAEWLDGDPAWAIIDRLSEKYTGQPYPLRTDRIVLLIEPDHAQAVAFA